MSTTTDTTGHGDDLDQIEAALDRMAAVEDWTLTDDPILTQLDRLGILTERMAGLRLRRAGVVEARGICKARGWTTADHLMVSDRTPLRAARAYVYFSRHLARFALIGDALCDGTVTRDQAEAMLHGLKHLPDEVTDDQLTTVQNALIAEAEELHPNDLRVLANQTVAVLFPEAEDDRLNSLLEREEARARRDRFLTHGRTASPDPLAPRRLHLGGERCPVVSAPPPPRRTRPERPRRHPLDHQPRPARLPARDPTDPGRPDTTTETTPPLPTPPPTRATLIAPISPLIELSRSFPVRPEKGGLGHLNRRRSAQGRPGVGRSGRGCG